MRRLLTVLVVGLLLGGTTPAHAFGTSPDPTYGTNGKVSFAGATSDPVMVQVGAWTYVAYSFWGRVREEPVVQRLDANGVPDPTFGAGGLALLGPHGHATSLAVTGAGEIYVAVRNSANPTPRWSTGVMHLRPDGTWDKTYGDNGLAKTGTTIDLPDHLSASDSGWVLIAGLHGDRSGTQLRWSGYVERLKPDGSLDAAFSRDGRRDFPVRNDYVTAAWAVGAKTMVAGGSGQHSWVMRLRANGSIDHSYAVDGVRPISVRAGHIRVLIAGPTTSGVVASADVVVPATHQTRLLTVHLTPDGQFDTSYSGDGRALLDVCTHCYVNDWDILPDGSVAALGARTSSSSSRLQPWVAVVQPDGSGDPGVGTGGWAFLGRSRAHTYFTDVTMDGDGLLVGSDILRLGQERAVVSKYVVGL